MKQRSAKLMKKRGSILVNKAIRVSKSIKNTKPKSINALQRTIYLPLKDEERKNNLLQPESVVNNSLLIRLSDLKLGNIVLTGVSGEIFN